MAEVTLDLAALDAEVHIAAQKELARMAEHAVHIARSLAPVRTGKLRESIHAAVVADGVVIGSDLPYALPVEFGSEDTPAQPYLLPAIYAAAKT